MTVTVAIAIKNNSINFQNESNDGLPLGEARFDSPPDLPFRAASIKASNKDCG